MPFNTLFTVQRGWANVVGATKKWVRGTHDHHGLHVKGCAYNVPRVRVLLTPAFIYCLHIFSVPTS